MSDDLAYKYRAEILRAAFGPNWRETKVDDLHRLNQYVNRLVECEETQRILLAKGYGRAGMTLLEIVRSLPENVRGMLRGLFRAAPKPPAPPPSSYPDLGEVFDIWTAR